MGTTMPTCSWNWAVPLLVTLLLVGGLNVNARISMLMTSNYCAAFGCVDCGPVLNDSAYDGVQKCFSCDGDPVSDVTLTNLARDKLIMACCNWGNSGSVNNRCQKFDGQNVPTDRDQCVNTVYQRYTNSVG